MKRGDWVAEPDVYRPTFGVVREVYDDGTFNLVVYSFKGEKLGRVSPPEGGPTAFEPCCPQAHYRRIKQPEFPMKLTADHDWAPWIEWL